MSQNAKPFSKQVDNNTHEGKYEERLRNIISPKPEAMLAKTTPVEYQMSSLDVRQ